MTKEIFEIIANCATILTAIIASWAYFRFIWGERRRRNALEAHLRQEAIHDNDEGKRTILHLMANLSMTETEVLQAGFSSRKVRAVAGHDDQGRAVRIYFQYKGSDVQKPPKR